MINLSAVICFNADENFIRVKRSNETEIFSFKKVKDGVKSFGSKVGDVASKGYEEFKNLFSSNRKVGDYVANNIDIRVREEDDYEEVNVKKSVRSKREIGMVDELAELMKDIQILVSTEGNKFKHKRKQNFMPN